MNNYYLIKIKKEVEEVFSNFFLTDFWEDSIEFLKPNIKKFLKFECKGFWKRSSIMG